MTDASAAMHDIGTRIGSFNGGKCTSLVWIFLGEMKLRMAWRLLMFSKPVCLDRFLWTKKGLFRGLLLVPFNNGLRTFLQRVHRG